MKLKNILSMVCFLCLAVSCSMDDETVMNDISKEIEATQGEGKEAFVAVQMNFGELATKSVTAGNSDNTTDQEINNLALFLLDGDNVINKAFFEKDQFTRDEDGTLKTSEGEVFGFLTKKKNTLSMIAVANTDANILAKTTRSAIETYAATLDNCTKYKEVNNFGWLKKDGQTAYPGYEKINGADGALAQAPAFVKIVLQQSYARVELASFNVKRNEETTKDVSVKLTGVKLYNINTNGQVNGTEKNFSGKDDSFPNLTFSCMTSEEACKTEKGLNLLVNNASDHYFRTFAYNYKNSDDSDKMKMEISYEVGVNKYTKVCVIEGRTADLQAVEAGYIYRLNLTVTVKANEVDCDVVCYTQDWIPNEISGTLTR